MPTCSTSILTSPRSNEYRDRQRQTKFQNWEVIFSPSCSPAPPGNPGILGNLGILVRNGFAPSQNHFHGLKNYWEVKLSQGKVVYQRVPLQKLCTKTQQTTIHCIRFLPHGLWYNWWVCYSFILYPRYFCCKLSLK